MDSNGHTERRAQVPQVVGGPGQHEPVGPTRSRNLGDNPADVRTRILSPHVAQ
jgi:hypothetical protein